MRVALAGFACVLVTACSGGQSAGATGDGGSPDGVAALPRDAGVVPRVTLTAKLVRGTRTAEECPDDGATLSIGTFVPSAPVNHGASQNGRDVSVACKVAELAGGPTFNATANVSLGGAGGGALVLTAPNTAGDTVDASLELTLNGLTFVTHACTLTMDPASGQGIAAGRYWAHLSCLGALASSQKRFCDVEGEVRFEDCTAD